MDTGNYLVIPILKCRHCQNQVPTGNISESLRSKTVIGAYNANPEENEAFIGFTHHFISKGFPVPEIFGYLPEKNIYFLQDLGDMNLFTWLQHKHAGNGFDDEAEELYQENT